MSDVESDFAALWWWPLRSLLLVLAGLILAWRAASIPWTQACRPHPTLPGQWEVVLRWCLAICSFLIRVLAEKILLSPHLLRLHISSTSLRGNGSLLLAFPSLVHRKEEQACGCTCQCTLGLSAWWIWSNGESRIARKENKGWTLEERTLS